MTVQYLIKRIIYLVLALPLLMAACNKSLDLHPSDSIDASKAYRKVSDLNEGLIGAYASLGYSSIHNVSLVSDECTLPNDNTTGKNVSTYRWQLDPSNGTITTPWLDNYVAIDRVNRVLAAVDVVASKPSEAGLKAQYKGELLALRAYAHMELLRNFAEKYEPEAMGVPYMETSQISSPAREKVSVVIGKINADLEAAKKLLPDDFTDVTRITKIAVSAIQARVALYEKNWTNAATYAQEVIDAMPLATGSDFGDIWTDKGESEVCWKLKKTAAEGILIGDIYYDTRKRLLYTPSYELVNLFDKVRDIRFAAYVLKVDNPTSGNSPWRVNKYLSKDGYINLADIKLFRTGEMYLIKAEALAEGTNLSGAADAINDLREARITGYVRQTFANKQALIDAIYTERFKELAFEGHRFFDLRRRNLSVTREPADAINAIGAILLKSTDVQYVFPIPDAEIRANKNMKQNPDYE
jgi:hypothetical protein